MKKLLLSILLIPLFGFVIYGQSSPLEVFIKVTSSQTDTLTDGTIVTINKSTDDVEEENDLTKSWIEALYDDDLDVGWEGEATKMNILSLGLRFRDIAIPQGATIDSAFLTVYAHEGKSALDVCILNITGEAADNAETFNDVDLVTARTMTSASLKWTIDEEWIMWKPYTSPDLGHIIQEIVNRPGWSWNNAIALILAGENQGPSDYENAREFMSFENIQDPGDVDPDGVQGDGKNHPDKVPKLTIYSASVPVPGIHGPKSAFDLYPNPAEGMVNIFFKSSAAARVQIFNVTGQMVRSEEITSQKTSLDVRDLKSGIYMFRAIQGNSIHTQKVILK